MGGGGGKVKRNHGLTSFLVSDQATNERTATQPEVFLDSTSVESDCLPDLRRLGGNLWLRYVGVKLIQIVLP